MKVMNVVADMTEIGRLIRAGQLPEHVYGEYAEDWIKGEFDHLSEVKNCTVFYDPMVHPDCRFELLCDDDYSFGDARKLVETQFERMEYPVPAIVEGVEQSFDPTYNDYAERYSHEIDSDEYMQAMNDMGFTSEATVYEDMQHYLQSMTEKMDLIRKIEFSTQAFIECSEESTLMQIDPSSDSPVHVAFDPDRLKAIDDFVTDIVNRELHAVALDEYHARDTLYRSDEWLPRAEATSMLSTVRDRRREINEAVSTYTDAGGNVSGYTKPEPTRNCEIRESEYTNRNAQNFSPDPTAPDFSRGGKSENATQVAKSYVMELPQVDKLKNLQQSVPKPEKQSVVEQPRVEQQQPVVEQRVEQTESVSVDAQRANEQFAREHRPKAVDDLNEDNLEGGHEGLGE